MKEYWTPRYKYQLVKGLSKKYPEDRPKLSRMTKKQLYAIWHNVRQRQARAILGG